MTVNIQLDGNLVNDAMKLTRRRSPRIVVEDALREYTQQRKRLRIFDLAGTIDYNPAYDYKANRKLKRCP